MKFKFLLYIYVFLGITEILLVGVDLAYSIVLRPVCVLIIYCFYLLNVKRQNYYLLFYLTCELINECFFLIDFVDNFVLVLTCYSLATITMIYHLWPVFKQNEFKLDVEILLGPALGILGTFYVFWELSLMVFDNLPNNYIFFPALASLLAWVTFCSLTPLKNRNPDNTVFYVLGGAMAIMAPTMFIYTFLWEYVPVLIMSLVSMLVLKIALVWYMVRLDYVLASKTEYF